MSPGPWHKVRCSFLDTSRGGDSRASLDSLFQFLHHFCEEIFPGDQPKPSLASLTTIRPCPCKWSVPGRGVLPQHGALPNTDITQQALLSQPREPQPSTSSYKSLYPRNSPHLRGKNVTEGRTGRCVTLSRQHCHGCGKEDKMKKSDWRSREIVTVTRSNPSCGCTVQFRIRYFPDTQKVLLKQERSSCLHQLHTGFPMWIYFSQNWFVQNIFKL